MNLGKVPRTPRRRPEYGKAWVVYQKFRPKRPSPPGSTPLRKGEAMNGSARQVVALPRMPDCLRWCAKSPRAAPVRRVRCLYRASADPDTVVRASMKGGVGHGSDPGPSCSCVRETSTTTRDSRARCRRTTASLQAGRSRTSHERGRHAGSSLAPLIRIKGAARKAAVGAWPTRPRGIFGLISRLYSPRFVRLTLARCTNRLASMRDLWR